MSGRIAGVLFLALVAGCAGGCAGGGAGGGGGAGAATAGARDRLVAIERQALSPSAAPRLVLVATSPAGATPASFALEESADGVRFSASGAIPWRIAGGAAFFDLPMPAGPRYYRLAAPVRTNEVAVLRGASAPAAPAIVSPPATATGVGRTAPISASAGGPGTQSYLFVIADEEGTIAALAETDAPRFALGGPVAATFVFPAGGLLAGKARYLATAIALDDERFGAAESASARVDFETAN